MMSLPPDALLSELFYPGALPPSQIRCRREIKKELGKLAVYRDDGPSDDNAFLMGRKSLST